MLLEDAFELCGLREFVRFQLKRAYSEPHRRYHTLEHLENMLRWLPSLKGREGFVEYETTLLVNAILFHDIVYLPRPVSPGYNEALSAVEYTIQEYWLKTPFVEGQLYPRLGSTLFEAYVIEAINASAHHSITQQNLRATSEWFLDLDLQSFGQPYDEFEKDSQLCCEEASLIYKNETHFYKAQALFFEQLLARPQIYYRMTEWEEQARSNIKKRLDGLVTV